MIKIHKRNYFPLIFLIILFVSGIFIFREKIKYYFFAPRQNIVQEKVQSNTIPSNPEDIEIVAKNLNIPWEIAFLPGGDMLVTERSGKLLKIGSETQVIKEIEGVKHIGEGGLLGLILHPNFSLNSFIYLYSTTQDASGITNRVEDISF